MRNGGRDTPRKDGSPGGKGEYWVDDEAFYFLRTLTQDPIVIPFDKVGDLKVGTWHCGRWAWGNPIVKFLWSHQGQALSSGFVLSYEKAEVQRLVDEISQRVSSRQKSPG
jgi:hypothetical protein